MSIDPSSFARFNIWVEFLKGEAMKVKLILVIFCLCFSGVTKDLHAADRYECQRSQRLYRTSEGFEIRTIEYLAFPKFDKMILLIPPVGGTNFFDRRTARFFCQKGISTLVLDSWTDFDRDYALNDLGSLQKELNNAGTALLSLLNYFKDKKIGIYGTSKGAIGATAFRKYFPSNVTSMFLVVAGSPLELTISRAGEEGLKDLRERRMELFRLSSISEYDEMVKSNLSSTTSSGSGDSIRLAMVLSKNDKTVPTSLQENLVRKWQPQKLWVTRVDHVKTIALTFTQLKDDALKFFLNSF